MSKKRRKTSVIGHRRMYKPEDLAQVRRATPADFDEMVSKLASGEWLFVDDFSDDSEEAFMAWFDEAHKLAGAGRQIIR